MTPAKASYWRRRAARHATLALISAGIGIVVWELTAHRSRAEGLSFATAYAGLVLLATALSLGPLNVLRQRPNPVSTDRRRDVGIWAALCGIAHTLFGLQVHMHGVIMRYFVSEGGGPLTRSAASFFAANYAGLAGALLLVLLLLLSNDFALRELGAPGWKLLQRSSYIVGAAVLFHGALYQLLEGRRGTLVLFFCVATIAVLVLQIAGVRAQRMRDSLRRQGRSPEAAADPQ